MGTEVVTSELPNVRAAVEHLGDLGRRMKDDQFGFEEHDVMNLDAVIEALMDLENERQHMRDKLETETITASILRHKLSHFPREIRAEIAAAVSGARKLNEDILTRLQTELRTLTEESEEMDSRLEQLEGENAKLMPERDQVKIEHEEIIATLNQCLADKASLQINLNETRDQVRQTNQQIVDLEEGIILLKEDLIQERADARQEKQVLKKTIGETASKTKEQKQRNSKQKVDLDRLQHELYENETNLDDLRKSIRKYETSRSKMEEEEQQLQMQLSRRAKQNEELRRRALDYTNEIARATLEFQQQQDAKTTKIHELQKSNKSREEKSAELEVTRIGFKEDLHEAMIVRKEDAERVADLQGALNQAKAALAEKAEDVGRLMLDNKEMMEGIEQLQESHRVFMAQMNKQIGDLRETLKQERSDRLEAQTKHEEVSRGQDSTKLEVQKALQDMNKEISHNKQKQKDLEREKQELTEMLETYDSKISVLEVEVGDAEAEYLMTREKTTTEIDRLTREISEMKRQVEEAEGVLEEKEPVFAALERTFDEQTDVYNDKKKSVISLRSDQKGKQETSKKYTAQIERNIIPMNKLKGDLGKRRTAQLEAMRANNAEVRDVETSIHNRSLKLKAVMDENAKLQAGIDELEANLDETKEREVDNERRKKLLLQDLEDCKAKLMEKWENDRKMEREYASRDEKVVSALGTLLAATEQRSEKITGIAGQLEQELVVLSDFLDNVAKRRPNEAQPLEERTDSRLSGGSKTPSRPPSVTLGRDPLPPITPRKGTPGLSPPPEIVSVVDGVEEKGEEL